MIRVTLLFVFTITVFIGQSQIVEATIAPENNRDYMSRRILLSTADEVYIEVSSGTHSDDGYCNSDVRKSICKLSLEGELIAEEEVSSSLRFYDMLHLGGSQYVQVGSFPCHKTWTEPNGVGHSYQSYTLIAGVVDTIGVSDSSLNFVASFENPNCDFGYTGYMGTAYKEGVIYGLYKRRNDYDKCKYLWKIDPTSGNMEQIQTQRDLARAQMKEDQSGFYALFHDSDHPHIWQLGVLNVDGSAQTLSSSISHEAEEEIPQFLYKNGMLFTAAANYLKSTEIRRYDLEGNLLGSITTGYKTLRMFLTSVGLLVIQEPITPSNGEDPKPLKMLLLDFDMNEIDSREFGFEYLGVHDFHFLEASEVLTIVGRVNHSHIPEVNQENKKAYFFRAKISDIFPNATAIESLESGRIYPNPSNDSAVFLELKNSDELESDAELVLRFFDVQGKSVNPSYSKTGPALYEINSSELPAGTYLGVVETADGERVFSQLFVVDR